jgi:Methyltransferase domain
MTEGTIWKGRVERKVRRKCWVELSLKVPDVEKTQTLMVMKDDATYVQHGTCLLLEALVRATVTPDHFRGDGRTWRVQRLELLECPPVPLAVKEVLQVPELWDTLKPYQDKDQDSNDVEEEDNETEDYTDVTHALVKRIVMRLQGRQPTQPRVRPPRVGPAMIRALEEMEQQVELVNVRVSSLDEVTIDNNQMALVGLNLPQTEDDRVLVSAHHKLTRQEYLESKKHPQVAWFLQRLRKFSKIRHILDVGGGRGDLAITLASGLGPETRVTVIDMNESSLEAGRRFAAQCGVGDRMNWVCDDFVSYSERNESTDVDMVVALHACGYLSDLALEYAVRQKASFVICPCCYSKMKQKSIATKLAEISEATELSRRAMHVINSGRYWDLMSQGSYQILLEEYSRAWSSRNMVMIGWPVQQGI